MGKYYKILISFIVSTILIMSMEINVYAAAFNAPYLPYIPPSDVQLLGLINNMYGITAISEGTETENIEAYWNMYRAVMGSAFESFKTDLQIVLDNAKTSRKIYISTTLNQNILAAIKNAKNNGVVIGQAQPPATTPQQWVDELYQHGIKMTLAMATDLKSRIDQYGYVGNGQPYTLGVGVNDSGEIKFWPYYVGVNTYFGPSPVSASLVRFLHDNDDPNFYQYIYYIDYEDMDVWRFKNQAYTGSSFRPYNNLYFKMSGNEMKTNLYTMSTSAADSIEDKTQIPLTADSVVENGVLDVTKPIVANLPISIPLPADDYDDIAAVLDDLGIVPISETSDVSQTVTELKEEAASKFGDVGDYSLNLTNLFPFCIPFDIGYAINIFAADPQAPSFDWVFPVGYEDGELIYETLNVNLSAFDSVALVLRKGLDVLLIIGLGMITRDKFLRG